MSETNTKGNVKDQQHLVSICAVVRNDQDIVEDFLKHLSSLTATWFTFYEILLIDNHSSDDTVEHVTALQDRLPNIRIIRLSRLHSSETAITAALDNSIGDYVVILEPRYDNVQLIQLLIHQAQNGYDVVVVRQDGKRYLWIDRILGNVAYYIAGQIIGSPIDLRDSRYRVYSRRAVNALSQIRRKRRYLKYAGNLIGYKQTFFPVNVVTKGVVRKPIRRLESVSLIIDLVVSNSAMPLRMTSLIGLGASFLGLLYLIYVIGVALVNDNVVEGWLTTNIVMTTMFFFLFLVLTILSEYIARILDETKDEPLYFIEVEYSSKVAPYTRIKEEVNSINVVED